MELVLDGRIVVTSKAFSLSYYTQRLRGVCNCCWCRLVFLSRANAALVLGFVNVFALVGKDKTLHLIYEP